MTNLSSTRWVLKCGKCGWQQSYPFNPAWEGYAGNGKWRDCAVCGTRNSVTKRNETNRG